MLYTFSIFDGLWLVQFVLLSDVPVFCTSCIFDALVPTQLLSDVPVFCTSYDIVDV